MQAILIDPELQSIKKVDYNGDYTTIYPMIDCKIFTIAYIDDKESIFLDDNGMYVENRFGWRHGDVQFVGKGLIVGYNDEGDSVGTELSIVEVVKAVTFMGSI